MTEIPIILCHIPALFSMNFYVIFGAKSLIDLGLTRRIHGGKVYGMNTKLTLRMDSELIRMAKTEAERRGKSVSQIVGDFFDSLASGRRVQSEIPPVTASLIGVMKARGVSESDYRKHLREKYL